MPPNQKLIAFWGIAKQAAKGSSGTTPLYGGGARSGKIINIPIAQDLEAITLPGAANDRFAPAANRTDASPMAAFVTRAWPKSLPLWMYLGLGTLGTTGAGPYTHTTSPAQDLPYFTLFTAYGSGERVKLPDCKVDEWTVSWDERNPTELELSILGLVPALGASSWTATNDESTQTYYGPSGGTFQLDVGSATPATGQVVGATIHGANNLQGIPLSKSILPDDVFPGAQVIDGTIRLIPNDFTDWRKVVTGTGTGTAVRETPLYGSFSLKQTIDANTDVIWAASRAAFLIDFPDADPAGGGAEIECAFQVVRPADASNAFTCTARNGQSSYPNT